VPVDLRRGADRFTTGLEWLDSRHSFSFGPHYDAANTHFGLLVVSNDDVVAPGAGFESHPHRDMEIVTWVLAGALAHEDSAGHRGVVRPGLVQHMSAGTGVVHAEMNADPDEPVRFVQMWVLPERIDLEPSYSQADVSAALGRGGLTVVASGRPHPGAVRLHQPAATLHAGRLRAGERVTVPDAAYVHLYVARGAIDLDGADRLTEGDAARLTGAGEVALAAAADAEVLVWEMAAAV
jgi:redox-sensitive bicupin YhaK (pirin superfamily)